MFGMQVCTPKRSLALVVFSASIAVAQMGGGMGNGGGPMHGRGDDGNSGMGTGGMGAGSAMGMAGGMGVGSGMMNDLAVGPDGTAYVLRRTGTPQPGGAMHSGSASDWKTELVSLDRNGAEKWKLEIDAEMVSEPAFGADGKLFVTVADMQGQAGQSGGMMNSGFGSVTRKARLLVIVPTATSASVGAPGRE